MTEKRKNGFMKYKSKRVKYCGGGSGGFAKLEAGMKGVLISHDRNKEKFCRLDAFKLLNHFADEFYGLEKQDKAKDHDANDGSLSEDEDIATALSNEVKEIKDGTKGNSSSQRRFMAVKSGCNNLIFIRFSKDILPGSFFSKIVKAIKHNADKTDSNLPIVKNLLRTHPVEFSCSAYLDNMLKNIPIFLETKFEDVSFKDVVNKEFTIEYKCRNNSHLARQEVLDGLYEGMKSSKSGWKYNCRSQFVSVIIDVLKTVCLVSVVKDYYFYKKYNIRELLVHKALSLTSKTVINNSKNVSESKQDNLVSYEKNPEAGGIGGKIENKSDHAVSEINYSTDETETPTVLPESVEQINATAVCNE